MNDSLLREQLIFLLRGGQAHLQIEKILMDFPADRINKRIEGIDYTP